MAKHGYPITKEYRIERSLSLYIVVDTFCFSKKRNVDYQETADGSMKLPVPLIERSIVAADILISHPEPDTTMVESSFPSKRSVAVASYSWNGKIKGRKIRGRIIFITFYIATILYF